MTARNGIGRRLRQIRGPDNQRDFARYMGTCQQAISNYERGRIPLQWEFLRRLRRLEKVDLNELLR